jgi:hypothetical protein
MKETPILFKAKMVRAILEGRKTMTRRIVKPQPNAECTKLHHSNGSWQFSDESFDRNEFRSCPFGVVGDRLWVRETWSQIPEMKPSGYFSNPKWVDRVAWYAADCDKPTWGGKWRPSIHMPRWASRITLEITGIKVERLNSIGVSDAKAEGIVAPTRHIGAFRDLWELINGPDSWDDNPWVWVVSFKKI